MCAFWSAGSAAIAASSLGRPSRPKIRLSRLKNKLQRRRVEALLADQLSRQAVQQIPMLAEDRRRSRVALVEHAVDLVVDQLTDVLRVVLLSANVASQKDPLLFVTERHWAQAIAHP